jgi:hypothetical protein
MAAAGLATDGTQSQGDGQSSAADSQSDTGQSTTTQQTHSTSSGQTQTPGLQAGAYRLSLTEAQRKRLVEEGVLDLSEEQYTGGVRHQIESLRKRASTAEKKLSDIAAAQAEADHKALEEQARYKELYEKERQARETEPARNRRGPTTTPLPNAPLKPTSCAVSGPLLAGRPTRAMLLWFSPAVPPAAPRSSRQREHGLASILSPRAASRAALGPICGRCKNCWATPG